MIKESRWGLFFAAGLIGSVINAAAQNSNWQLLSPSQVPEMGSFYFMSTLGGPPVPVNPYPGCDVYAVGSNIFVVECAGRNKIGDREGERSGFYQR
jgi:hypothetical protein